jgi:hypothetical protein
MPRSLGSGQYRKTLELGSFQPESGEPEEELPEDLINAVMGALRMGGRVLLAALAAEQGLISREKGITMAFLGITVRLP